MIPEFDLKYSFEDSRNVNKQISAQLKVIRKFFLNHNKSFRWHLGDYENIFFFHLKACERRNFDLCVFFGDK